MAHRFNRLNDANAARSLQDITSGAVPLVLSPSNPMVGFYGAILAAYFFVIKIGSIPFRLLMRKNLGERAFTVFSYFLSVLCIAIILPAGAWMGYGEFLGFSFHIPKMDSEIYIIRLLFHVLVALLNPYTFLMIVFLEKGRVHYSQILELGRNKQYIYSFYQGKGIHFEHKKEKKFWGFQVNDTIVRMIYEPIGMLKFSIPILIANYVLIEKSELIIEDTFYLNLTNTFIAGLLLSSLMLTLGAIFTFLLEFSAFQQERGAALDILDGEADMQRILFIKENLLALSHSEMEKEKSSLSNNKTSESLGTVISE